MSASLPVPEASDPSPAESLNTPRVSLNTAVRREALADVLLATASPLKRSTGRVGEALRSTHFHSSLIRLPFSIGGEANWIELNSVFRLTLSTLAIPGCTRIPFRNAGTNAARVTLME